MLTAVSAQKIFGLHADVCEIPSPHLLVVPKNIAELADPTKIVARGLSFLRHTNRGRVVYAERPAHELTMQDIRFLAERCDGKKKAANDRVKGILVNAIEGAAAGQPIHLFDIGCGTKPIINKMSRHANLAFTGIDCLDQKMDISPHHAACVTNPGNMPISWKAAFQSAAVAEGRIPVCTATYSLHFFDKGPFPDQMGQIIDREGFFAGNLHLTGNGKQKKAQWLEMQAAILKSGWDYDCVMDGRSNSFFVIADESQSAVIDTAMDCIKRSITNLPACRR